MPVDEQRSVEEQILAYLERCATDGSSFTKSRHIADELDISVKRVGTIMATLEADSTAVHIHRWGGGSDGITWYIETGSDSRNNGAST
ncbi:DUF7123 family protein [Halobacterium noricense]|uniref:DUF7123 family protein n=1 Tax=Halobacterium noricense TaxID=223182 RepID=UPI000A8D0B26